MKQRIFARLLLPLVFAAVSCGPADNDPGPGGVTVGEARALDEAAAMIDQRRLPEEALPETDEEEAPKPPEIDRATEPSDQ